MYMYSEDRRATDEMMPETQLLISDLLALKMGKKCKA